MAAGTVSIDPGAVAEIANDLRRAYSPALGRRAAPPDVIGVDAAVREVVARVDAAATALIDATADGGRQLARRAASAVADVRSADR